MNIKEVLKLSLTVAFSILMVACSSKHSVVADSNDATSDNQRVFPYEKTICFPLNYEATRATLDEDIKLLTDTHFDMLKGFFDSFLTDQLSANGYKVVDNNCNYTIEVKELVFKEFKLQVAGPEVNVATAHIDYILKTPQKDTVLFNEINRESIPDFEETVFQDLCNELAAAVVKKVTWVIDVKK